ncbi:putative guanosine-3',5'-bis(diphosphate) 3'-pyrophosphohydrolase [Porphyridium purpureum]|uniref:Putative guanosine-3',5'-bis(Diphosphate) 3'-pyrophosphohydrolase n=1 Tax=Porphyridium purpureum TaxID=35688 RepID=A0A5J4Z3Y4_PORPP|nr:putative guanosine-3',5'-bis(diphosphate) 3'-pyrophosphohydrolase [Porphyridium purpureum]|eukprot:POR7813..scf295_1
MEGYTAGVGFEQHERQKDPLVFRGGLWQQYSASPPHQQQECSSWDDAQCDDTALMAGYYSSSAFVVPAVTTSRTKPIAIPQKKTSDVSAHVSATSLASVGSTSGVSSWMDMAAKTSATSAKSMGRREKSAKIAGSFSTGQGRRATNDSYVSAARSYSSATTKRFFDVPAHSSSVSGSQRTATQSQRIAELSSPFSILSSDTWSEQQGFFALDDGAAVALPETDDVGRVGVHAGKTARVLGPRLLNDIDVPMTASESRQHRLQMGIRQLNSSVSYLGPVARNKIVRALELVSESSSSRVFARALAVVNMLAELRMDLDAVLAGALKGASISTEQMEQNVGPDAVRILRDNAVAQRVLNLTTPDVAEPRAVRELALKACEDWRAVALELVDAVVCWRLVHAGKRDPAARDFAHRILDLFAPIAHQLGIWNLQCELEEIAFEFLYPEDCMLLRRLVAEKLSECADVLEDTKRQVEAALTRNVEVRSLVSSVRIKGRCKGLYSIFRKMQRNAKSFDEVYDLLALRIVVEPRLAPSGTRADQDDMDAICCRKVLDVIHSEFEQFGSGSRFKDFLSSPKPNGYKSLHTTVLVGDHAPMLPLEMQVRTSRMHRLAEFGYAAHWIYKESVSQSDQAVAGPGTCRRSGAQQGDTDNDQVPFLPRDEFSFAGKECISMDQCGDGLATGSTDLSREGLPEDLFEGIDFLNVDSHAEYISKQNETLRKTHVVVLSEGKLHYVRSGTTLLEFSMRLGLRHDQISALRINGVHMPITYQLKMSDIVTSTKSVCDANGGAAAAGSAVVSRLVPVSHSLPSTELLHFV